MKPEDVLKIHELIMVQYDRMLALHSDDEPGLMTAIQDIAENYAPAVVSGLYASQCEGNDQADAKILHAGLAASKAALSSESVKNQLQDGSSVDMKWLKETFRHEYAAALRFELYRQFVAINQDLENLKVEFVKAYNVAPQSKKDLIQFALLLQSEKVSSEFKKFEKAHMLTAEEQQKIRQLKDDVYKWLDTFCQANRDDKYKGEQGTELFYKNSMMMQARIEKLIGKYRIETESNQSWAPLLKNLLMMLTGVGVIVLAISLGVKAATGQYAFFDKTSLKEVADNERSASEKLITPPKNVS